MKVATAKAINRQTLIFDPDPLLESTGAARSWVGDFFEQLTASLTSGLRLKTDSGCDICPDILLQAGGMGSPARFAECKAVGQSGQAIMYKCRFEKDRRAIEENGLQIYYFFWRHRSPVLASETINHLRGALAGSIERVGIISRQTLEEILANRQPRRINSQYQKNGPQNYAKYGEGWAFPIAEVFARCQQIGGKRAFAYHESPYVRVGRMIRTIPGI